MVARICICGSRNYTNREKIVEVITRIPENSIILHGDAPGVDRMAGEIAEAHNLWVIKYPANWEKYGRSAGARRSAMMIAEADEVIAFWDGQSPGTRISIDIAKRLNKPLTIYR